LTAITFYNSQLFLFPWVESSSDIVSGDPTVKFVCASTTGEYVIAFAPLDFIISTSTKIGIIPCAAPYLVITSNIAHTSKEITLWQYIRVRNTVNRIFLLSTHFGI
jgi:hypothetical protein